MHAGEELVQVLLLTTYASDAWYALFRMALRLTGAYGGKGGAMGLVPSAEDLLAGAVLWRVKCLQAVDDGCARQIVHSSKR